MHVSHEIIIRNTRSSGENTVFHAKFHYGLHSNFLFTSIIQVFFSAVKLSFGQIALICWTRAKFNKGKKYKEDQNAKDRENRWSLKSLQKSLVWSLYFSNSFFWSLRFLKFQFWSKFYFFLFLVFLFERGER